MNSKSNNISWKIENNTLIIQLANPERLNILTVQLRKKIRRVLKKHERDPNIRCVVFRAEGKVFSAGADLNYLLKLNGKKAVNYARFVREFMSYLENYPKPTIGVVEGVAVGGGLELLLSLDMVIASEEARFGQTELNVGLIPGGGGTQRLSLIVGPRIAKEMVFTGRLLSAREAKEYGLINFVTSREGLEPQLREIVEKITSKDSRLLEIAKKAINNFAHLGLERGLEFESQEYIRILSSNKAKTSIRGFLKKKKQ